MEESEIGELKSLVFVGRIRKWRIEVSGLCLEESENGKCSSGISCGELDAAAGGQRRARQVAGEIKDIRNKVKEIRQNDAIGRQALHNDDLYDRMMPLSIAIEVSGSKKLVNYFYYL
ncbi:hypothetical protein KY284_007936 [Solanum tuberosum]|nr:hypothetical protein KY284_007936 [Solanum tuberosum]